MKIVRNIVICMVITMFLFTACAPAAQPQVIEVTRMVEGTPETIVVTAQPESRCHARKCNRRYP